VEALAEYNDNDEAKEDDVGRACSTNGHKKEFMWSRERTRPLGRPTQRREGNVELYLGLD
jgi:hypothetical protein